jgi:hypothetical protein
VPGVPGVPGVVLKLKLVPLVGWWLGEGGVVG